MAFRYYNWSEVNIKWGELNMKWKEVGILISDVLPNVSPPISGKPRHINLEELNKLPEEKKRIIIKIACEIEGSEYIEYKYKNEEINIRTPNLKIVTDWKQKFRTGPGLFNAGNTCFLNSVLQTLTHTPPFVNYLLDKTHSKVCQLSTAGKFCSLCTFQKHIG